MSEKEKQIVEKLKEAIPKMSEFDKGYILGKVEGMGYGEKTAVSATGVQVSREDQSEGR